MRGTKAKAMRKYVRDTFPFLSASPLYRRRGTLGTAVLAEQCQRAMYMRIKRAYKSARINATDSWRRYENESR